MKMRDMSIRGKLSLIAGSGLFFLLVFVVIGVAGMLEQSRAMKIFYEEDVRNVGIANRMMQDLRTSQENMFRAFTWVSIDADEVRLNDAIGVVQKTIPRLDTLAADLKRHHVGDSVTDSLISRLVQYRSWTDRAIDMISGDVATATLYMSTVDMHYRSADSLLTLILGEVSSESKSAYSASQQRSSFYAAGFAIGGVLGVLISVFLVFSIARRIERPLVELARTLSRMTGGEWDLTTNLAVDSGDEIGAVTFGVNTFIEKLHGIVSGLHGDVKTLSQTSSGLDLAASGLSRAMSGVAERSSAVAVLTATADADMSDVSRSAEVTSSEVSTVAAAIEEMNASLLEVARSCSVESVEAARAAAEALSATTTMDELGSAAREVGRVVDVISDIAEKINLLALNATIEAASAGEAGKGFAVVAREVKELASQTAGATADIARRVGDIQNRTNDAVVAIGRITGVIEKVNSISGAISLSVSQQTETVSELARSVGSASAAAANIARGAGRSALRLNEIAGRITEISTTVSETNQSVDAVTGNAGSLSRIAGNVRDVVDQFKI